MSDCMATADNPCVHLSQNSNRSDSLRVSPTRRKAYELALSQRGTVATEIPVKRGSVTLDKKTP